MERSGKEYTAIRDFAKLPRAHHRSRVTGVPEGASEGPVLMDSVADTRHKDLRDLDRMDKMVIMGLTKRVMTCTSLGFASPGWMRRLSPVKKGHITGVVL